MEWEKFTWLRWIRVYPWMILGEFPGFLFSLFRSFEPPPFISLNLVPPTSLTPTLPFSLKLTVLKLLARLLLSFQYCAQALL